MIKLSTLSYFNTNTIDEISELTFRSYSRKLFLVGLFWVVIPYASEQVASVKLVELVLAKIYYFNKIHVFCQGLSWKQESNIQNMYIHRALLLPQENCKNQIFKWVSKLNIDQQKFRLHLVIIVTLRGRGIHQNANVYKQGKWWFTSVRIFAFNVFFSLSRKSKNCLQ